MPLTRRYSPEWGPLDGGIIGYDFSNLLPPGVGIAPGINDFSQTGPGGEGIPIPTPRLEIWANFAIPLPSPEDWWSDPGWSLFPGWYWQYNETLQLAQWLPFPPGAPPPADKGMAAMALGVQVRGRSVMSWVSGGDPGVDYQFRWIIIDTLGQRHTRTGLLLVGETS